MLTCSSSAPSTTRVCSDRKNIARSLRLGRVAGMRLNQTAELWWANCLAIWDGNSNQVRILWGISKPCSPGLSWIFDAQNLGLASLILQRHPKHRTCSQSSWLAKRWDRQDFDSERIKDYSWSDIYAVAMRRCNTRNTNWNGTYGDQSTQEPRLRITKLVDTRFDDCPRGRSWYL